MIGMVLVNGYVLLHYMINIFLHFERKCKAFCGGEAPDLSPKYRRVIGVDLRSYLRIFASGCGWGFGAEACKFLAS